MEPLKTNFFTFALSLAAIVAIEIAAYRLELQEQSPALLLLGLVRLMEIGVLVAILHMGSGGIGLVRFNEVTFKKNLWRSVAWSAACCLVIIALHRLIISVDPALWQQLVPKNEATAVSPVMLFITGSLLSPIAEELFFRRIIFTFFRRWGFYLATLISTGFFILPHQASATLPLLPIIGGIVLALVYEKEKYLLAPILVHITANTLFLLAI